MLELIRSGCNGRMGRVLEALCADQPDLHIAAGFDVLGAADRGFPVFSSPAECTVSAQVVIDFSHPAALTGLLGYCVKRRLPVVLATTGYSEAQLLEIESAKLARQAAQLLGEDFDIEIVERHHNRKVDAPSGTALLLADALSPALPYEPEYVWDRHAVRKPRERHEIGISSIRGGTIAGDHEILFAGRDEWIELRHSAQSKEVFASGALKAARFLAQCQAPGLYDMDDLLCHLQAPTEE